MNIFRDRTFQRWVRRREGKLRIKLYHHRLGGGFFVKGWVEGGERERKREMEMEIFSWMERQPHQL